MGMKEVIKFGMLSEVYMLTFELLLKNKREICEKHVGKVLHYLLHSSFSQFVQSWQKWQFYIQRI